MGSFADYLENELLDHAIGGATWSPPGTWYIAAYTATPSDAGGGTEVGAGNNYARVAVTNNATNFPAASGGAKSNGTAIVFPTASGSWGTIVAIAGLDASSSGNFGFWDDFTGVSIAGGDVLEIPAGDLDFTLD